MSEKPSIILIDGKNLAYRCHFAHIGLRTKEGLPSGLMHGFLHEILRINRKCPGSPQIFCWDGAGKTWRHELQDTYKGHRKKDMPGYKEMQAQLAELIPLLKTLGFWCPMVKGVEADDLIGILTKRLSDEYAIRIYSSDRDMYQLLGPNVTVWTRKKSGIKWHEELMDEKGAEDWLGAPLEALLEIKAMAGDPADNLKGLPKVGMKTASKLWKQGFRIKANNRKFKEHMDRLRTEYRMAQIITNVSSRVWTEEQAFELRKMAEAIEGHPGRRIKTSDQMRKAFYDVLGTYELTSLFQDRKMFWELP